MSRRNILFLTIPLASHATGGAAAAARMSTIITTGTGTITTMVRTGVSC